MFFIYVQTLNNTVMAKQEFFITYGRQLVVRLRAMHKPVAEKYRTSLNQLALFRNHQDIPFAEFTSPLMLAFESWLRKRVVRNTSSFLPAQPPRHL